MSPQTWLIRRVGRLQLRPSSWQALAVAAVFSLFYLFYIFAVPQLLRFRFRFDLGWYDLGFYGFGPSQGYASFDLESPIVEISEWNTGCDSRYTFLAPRGDSIAHPGPAILDADGELVWMKHNWETTQDFKVQRYKDTDYLTYWEGDATEGRGHGSWYMLDSTYTQRYVINPVGNFGGDLHEFHITPEGTALVTIYDPRPADLRSIGGPELGWIHDCLLQEIDISTGELLFEWRASEYFPVNSTYHTRAEPAGKSRTAAFDYFHINSVDQDDEGNYIISSRHLHMITCIDRRTGAVRWILGGKQNEFKDLSEGEATNFAWQHDARWHANNTLTLFDNGSHGDSDPERQSRGMSLQLDIPNREATLRGAYYHPQHMKAVSQGNLQMLDDSGRVLVGWGHSAAYSEFDADGQILCNVHFGASAFFSFGRVVSYRAFKGTWIGDPQTTPDAEVIGERVYVSWNGATEVMTWRLEALKSESLDEEASFVIINEYEKSGFETEIEIPEYLDQPLFRLVALDSVGDILGVTDLLQRESGGDYEELLNLHYWIVGIAFVMTACGICAGLNRCFGCCGYVSRRRFFKYDYQLIPLSGSERSLT